LISVRCDVCFNEKKIPYRKYIKNISKYNLYTCSSRCSDLKRRMTNLEKFGVERPLKSEEYRTKSRNTCLERYGVDNPMKMDDFKIKQKNERV
jgi:hypothetical protein